MRLKIDGMGTRLIFGLVLVVSLVLGVLSTPVLAGTIDQVKKDFAAVAGYVVMPTGSEYIIDLDATQGVTAGDLLSVVEQGEAIVHPVTGKVLGTMDKTIAVLQVSRVKTGYSYASAISGDQAQVKAGTKLQRFSNLSAVFRDESGSSEVLFAQLKAALPALQWQNSESATIADLFFTATPSGLQVRDNKGQLIRAYASENRAVNVVTPAVGQSAAVAQYGQSAVRYGVAPVIPQVYAAPAQPLNTGAVHYQNPTQVGSYSGSALNMEFPRFNKVGQFDKTTIMADFEKVGRQLLVATTDGSAIQVFAVGKELTPVASGDSATMGQILALNWYQPQPGETYLAVTVWSDDTINADLLRLDGNQLTPVVAGYGTLLAGFDVNSDGQSEMLMGQEFDREMFYGSRVRQLTIAGGSFNSTATNLAIPASFQIFGAVFTDISGDGQPETIFIRNHRLYIYDGSNQIYKSSKELGGSISAVTYDVDPDAQNPMITTASCNVAPIVADLDGDGKLEIVAIASDSNLLQAVGAASAINKSWLTVFKYARGMIMKGSLGDKLERPMSGLAVDKGQALMVATDVAGLLEGKEATYVLAIPVK